MSTAWRVQTTRHRCRLCAGRPLGHWSSTAIDGRNDPKET